MYKLSKIAQKVKSIPLLTVPMTPDNEEIVDIPEGQKDFMCVMDYTNIDKSRIPIDFNGMVTWAEYMTPTQDQAECGSCWAFASSTCLADRFNVIAKKKVLPSVSTNFSLLCSFNEDLLAKDVLQATSNYQSDQALVQKLNQLNSLQFQCGGNYLLTAWCALYASGTTTDECLPYKLVDPFKQQYERLDFAFNGRTAFLDTTSADTFKKQNFFFLLDKSNATWSCNSIVGNNKELCWEHTTIDNMMLSIPLRHYHCGLIYTIKDDRDRDAAIRYDIFKYGPVSTVMNMFEDFFTFDPINGGVYNPKEKIEDSTGGHAVEIVGWGTYENIPFWWIRNSWSPDWGISGCFRLARGNASLGVEDNVITGIPYFFFTSDQYDQFLDEFPKYNPITINSPYQNCLKNKWMQKYFAIYYKPIQVQLYDMTKSARLTFFRILEQHPGQKAVLYPEIGLTTKILSVYPGLEFDEAPDAEAILAWIRNGGFAATTSPSPNRYSRVFILYMILLFFFIILIALGGYYIYRQQRNKSSTNVMVAPPK